MKLHRLLATAALVTTGAVATLVPDTAEADPRTATAGTPLLTDFDDAFAFPHTILGTELMINADLRPSTTVLGTQGSGTIVLGSDTAAFGVIISRSDYQNGISNTLLGLQSNPFLPGVAFFAGGDAGLPTGVVNDNGASGGFGLVVPGVGPQTIGGDALVDPANFFDLLYAGGDEASRFGVRLSFGVGRSSFENDVTFDDSGTLNRSTAFAMGLTGSYGMVSEDSQLDVAASIGFSSATFGGHSTVGNDEIDLPRAGHRVLPTIELGARYLGRQGSSLQFGAYGATGFRATRGRLFSGDVGDEESYLLGATKTTGFFIGAGAGPVYTVDQARVTMDIGAGYSLLSDDPLSDTEEYIPGTTNFIPSDAYDDDATINSQLLLPTARIAGEFFVSDRLTLRTGLRGGTVFAFQREKVRAQVTGQVDGDGNPVDPPTSGADTRAVGTDYSFFWTAGFGYTFNDFSIHGAFNTEFLTNGPHFITGATSAPWLAVLSLRYDFGSSRQQRGAQAAPAESAAPATRTATIP